MSPNGPVDQFFCIEYGEDSGQSVGKLRCDGGQCESSARRMRGRREGDTEGVGAARGRICQEYRELQAYCWVSYRRTLNVWKTVIAAVGAQQVSRCGWKVLQVRLQP